uniref:ANK_REP_REGION domain-containing protein n=1 Tax=Macrostomum lignano TaxID=282301 RepID=A0A1I8FGU4_9PLAT
AVSHGAESLNARIGKLAGTRCKDLTDSLLELCPAARQPTIPVSVNQLEQSIAHHTPRIRLLPISLADSNALPFTVPLRNEATNSCLKWLVNSECGTDCLSVRDQEGDTPFPSISAAFSKVLLLTVREAELSHGSQVDTRWIAERRHQQRSQSEKTLKYVTQTGSGERGAQGSERDVDRVRKPFQRKLSFTIKEVAKIHTTAEIAMTSSMNTTEKVKHGVAKHWQFCLLPDGPRPQGASQGRDCIIDGHGSAESGSGARSQVQGPPVCPTWRQAEDLLCRRLPRSGTDEVTHRGLAVDQLPPEFAQNPPCTRARRVRCPTATLRLAASSWQTLCDYIEQFYTEKHLEDIMISREAAHGGEAVRVQKRERRTYKVLLALLRPCHRARSQVSFDPSKAQKRSRSLQLFSLGSR